MIKGQDLIEGAKIKKFMSKVKVWEISQWTFYDRKGRFAGDQDKDGLIGNGNNDKVKDDVTSIDFSNPPYEGDSGSEANTITTGSYKFYVFFGNDSKKNIMVICASSDCATAFTADQLNYIESLDASIDGTSDGTKGNFVGSNTAPDSLSTTTWVAKFSSAPTASAWTADTTKAAVYYFDRKR